MNMRWAGHVASVEENGNAFEVLVGKPEGNRPLGRSRLRWEDNIKIYLKNRTECELNSAD
jgi:hypothetical protein